MGNKKGSLMSNSDLYCRAGWDIPRELGTGFPRNPSTSGKKLGMSRAFLIIYTSERNDFLL
jgi:hypothetical protein